MKWQYKNEWVIPLRDYSDFLLHNIKAAGDEPNFWLLTGKCKHHIFYTIAFMILMKYWLIIKDYLEVTIYYSLFMTFSYRTTYWQFSEYCKQISKQISMDYILVNSNTVADRNKCGFIQQQFYNIIFSIQWWEPNAKYTHQAINST